MRSQLVVLLGAIALTGLGALAIVDHNRQDNRLARAQSRHAPCPYRDRQLCGPSPATERHRWNERKVWYGFAAGAIVLLTGTLAVAVRPRRT